MLYPHGELTEDGFSELPHLYISSLTHFRAISMLSSPAFHPEVQHQLQGVEEEADVRSDHQRLAFQEALYIVYAS